MLGGSSLLAVTLRLDCRRNLADYVRIWGGSLFALLVMHRPVSLVLYYRPSAESELQSLMDEASHLTSLTITPYRLERSTLPINTLKNMGVDAVKTTHYLFAEFNLVPSSTSYRV